MKRSYQQKLWHRFPWLIYKILKVLCLRTQKVEVTPERKNGGPTKATTNSHRRLCKVRYDFVLNSSDPIRLQKELDFYQKEEREQLLKIEQLKSSGAEPADIRMQERVLAETLAMIPDTRNRLEDLSWELTSLEVDSWN